MQTPSDLGMPRKFAGWRPHQVDAILSAAASDKRFVALCLPVGSGKSLTYMALASLMEAKSARVLTSTKGLQNQLMRDFSPVGLVDVRGQTNYRCELETELSVAEGPCHEGLSCHLRQVGCSYYDAIRVASKSRIANTNYAFWLTIHAYGDGLGATDLLICDEAHNAPDELSSFLEVKLTREEVDWCGKAPPDTGWSRWATQAKEKIARIASVVGGDIRAAKVRAKARGLILNLHRLSQAVEDEWVFVPGEFRWAPVWPSRYGPTLFRSAEKVILTSATIRPKTMAMLGLDDRDYEFLDYPSSFPVDRRPVSWIPTARIDKRATPAHYKAWIDRADEIIGGRLDRKGLFHTISYERAKMVLAHSKYRGIMHFHDRYTTRQVVERFKNAPAPAVLVSPSMSTGWDFPYDTARYQIIGKVAFPDTRDPVTARRSKEDKEYPMFLAMTELQQMVGRIVRADDDYGETFIIDDNIQWFLYRYKKFASRWFLEAFKKRKSVPKAMGIDP